MDQRQANPDSTGSEPDAARTPAGDAGPDEVQAYELPPPPPAGALWAPNAIPADVPAAGGRPTLARPAAASPDGDLNSPAAFGPGSEPGRSTVSRPGTPSRTRPASGLAGFAGSMRPVSVAPSAGAARASVPGALRPDASGVRANSWPSGQSKIYGARVNQVESAEADQPATPGGRATAVKPEAAGTKEPDSAESGQPKPTEPEPTEPKPTEPEPTEPEPTEPEPTEPEPTEPEPTEPEPTEPEPTEPEPTEPTVSEPEPPAPFPAPNRPTPPGLFPTPAPEPNPSPAPPGPGPSPVPPSPVPPDPEPSPRPGPVPPSPVPPSPVPPGPVPPGPVPPGPVPPSPVPSPVPGPPQPIYPAPPVIPAVSGLPAYTLPPSSGPQPRGAAPANGAPTDWLPANAPVVPPISRPAGNPPDGSTRPFGVGGSDGSGQPFGEPTAQGATPPTRPGTYASTPASTVNQPRGHGTVYGGAGAQPSPHGGPPAGPPIDMTMPVATNPLENSGSLTGHILAQGWDHGSDDHRRSNVKVGIAMLAVLVVLVGISLVFLLTAGSAFSNMIHGVFK